VLELNPGGLFVRLVRPVIYLDHFGLRRITEDDHLANRLVDALQISSGSLALSWLNLGEYATVTDRDQRLLAEKLINRILPAVFPLDVAPFDVHLSIGKPTVWILPNISAPSRQSWHWIEH